MNEKLLITQAIDGFILASGARHLSPHTIADYKNTFNKFLLYLDQDPPIAAIIACQVESFLASRDEVIPRSSISLDDAAPTPA